MQCGQPVPKTYRQFVPYSVHHPAITHICTRANTSPFPPLSFHSIFLSIKSKKSGQGSEESMIVMTHPQQTPLSIISFSRPQASFLRTSQCFVNVACNKNPVIVSQSLPLLATLHLASASSPLLPPLVHREKVSVLLPSRCLQPLLPLSTAPTPCMAGLASL